MKISPRKHRKACYISRLRFSSLFCKFDTMASPIFASAILCISSRYHHHQRSQCWSGYKETASLTDMPEHKYENNVTGPVRSVPALMGGWTDGHHMTHRWADHKTSLVRINQTQLSLQCCRSSLKFASKHQNMQWVPAPAQTITSSITSMRSESNSSILRDATLLQDLKYWGGFLSAGQIALE